MANNVVIIAAIEMPVSHLEVRQRMTLRHGSQLQPMNE